MFSLHLNKRLSPDLDIVLDPHRDGVVEHPGHGRHHPPYLPVPQYHPRQVHPDISATTWKKDYLKEECRDIWFPSVLLIELLIINRIFI